MNRSYIKKNILLLLILLACSYGCRKEEITCTPVDNVPDTTYVSASDQEKVCVFDNKFILIDAYVDSALSYMWSPTGDTTSSIVISIADTFATAEIIYAVEVTTPTTSFSWSTTASFSYCCCMIIPNSFTPNLDGKNDTWIPLGIGIGCFYMEVRNEDGILVYSTDDINEPWDGRINGSEDIGPCGLYFYYVYVEMGSQMDRNKSESYGYVELIK
ncbi:MAG: gliding motility-associated C-terminal domain-containing protein [Bacteroidota bacterium]